MSYQDTTLWKKAFAATETNKDIIDSLISEYETMRIRVSIMLEKIRKDFPNLTLHDISHADKLWELASVISGPDYKINPYEGFVFGGAILLHDAALSFDSFGGKSELQSKSIWRDYVSRQSNGGAVTDDLKDDADFFVIRQLHAQRAAELPTQEYVNSKGEKEFFIQSEYIRKRLGPLIGKIASSHHWPIDDVQTLDKHFIYGTPPDYIDAQKIACLLRCADAAHIDDSRAPDHLLKILNVNRVSMSHWNAQNHLSRIVLNPEEPKMLMIKSTYKYAESDFDAWNVAYDAACVLNNEIKRSNSILGENAFLAQGVSGTTDRLSFSKFVETDGWTPSECKIHVSKVAEMISSLGGKNLYGEDDELRIVLRELIQNARDAICARRFFEKDENFKGEIVVGLEKRKNHYYLTVKDNGVGMSQSTLTTTFLDFGESYWKSTRVINELPGLISSNFNPVGHFGIGFFSSFMVSDKAEVHSRKFNTGLDSNCTLCFPKGLTLTPILKKTMGSSTYYSTVIDLRLVKKPKHFYFDGEKVTFQDYVSSIAPGLDVDIFVCENGKKVQVHQDITSNDFNKEKWFERLLCVGTSSNRKLKQYVRENSKYLRFLYSEGQIVGLATLMLPDDSLYNTSISSINPFAYKTVGGLLSNNQNPSDYSYVGYFDFSAKSLSRDAGNNPRASDSDLSKWAEEQMKLLITSNASDEFKHLYLPQVLGQYHVLNSDLSFCEMICPFTGNRKMMSVQEVYDFLLSGGCIVQEKASIKKESSTKPDFGVFLKSGKILVLGGLNTFYGKYHVDGHSSYSFLRFVRYKAKNEGYLLIVTNSRWESLEGKIEVEFPIRFYFLKKTEK